MIAGILDAIRCKDMRWSTRVVWACLENHANGHRFWPMTMEAIVKEIGGTLDTVVSGVKELEQRGIIRRVMRKRRPTVYYMLREYNRDGQRAATEPEPKPAETFAVPETVSGLTPEESEPDSEPLPPDSSITTRGFTQEIPNETVNLTPGNVEHPVPTREESTSKVDPPGTARVRACEIEPPGFAEFYAAYPRKATGRKPVVVAFNRALREGARAEDIIAGLRRYRFSSEPRYQPHATTWLNQQRWQSDGGGGETMQERLLRIVGLDQPMHHQQPMIGGDD